MSLYWLTKTIAVLPLVLWVYLGLGLPYALLALPRQDWIRRTEVIALSFAFGSALLTAWMLILGTLSGTNEQAYLRFDLVFGGTIMLAVIGCGLLWRKWRTGQAVKRVVIPLAIDERLIIGLIVLAVVIRWVVTSFWSFTAYDALWVYGYQGRLYQMLGYIPQDIGYYPQYLPLQFTFLQLLNEGFDDHAARAVIPFIHIGSILAAYVMGSRLFNRRTGIVAAAIWTLYPHVAVWAHIGDLEIPLTFSLTLTMTFFLVAWQESEQSLRRRYAVIAGWCFGIAMWTKPTGGAFIIGVMLLVILDFIRVRFNWRNWYPRFEVALITGIACIPLGAVWYVRNVALGLPALVFPPSTWLSLATRSGDLLSFPMLALILAIVYVVSQRGNLRWNLIALIGLGLMLLGAMPSSPLINVARRNPPESYITLFEASLIISGLVMSLWALRDRWLSNPHPALVKIAWAYLLILPYFITWFRSYSYHARLSFAIVPIMILPIAVILAHWVSRETVSQWRTLPKSVWHGLIILLSLAGLTAPITHVASSWDYLWTYRHLTDFERTKLYNPGVGLVAEQLWGYRDTYGENPVVIAPGEQRLPFFMPDVEITSDTVPTTYEELEGATHFLYGTQPRWRYRDEGIDPLTNRVVASLGRDELFDQVLDFETGTFEYELYDLNLGVQNQMPDGGPAGHLIEDEVIFGDAIQYIGDSLNNNQLLGNEIAVIFLWQVIAPPQGDYLVQVDLKNTEDGQVYQSWRTEINPSEDGYYSTDLWEVGEFVIDGRDIFVNNPQTPMGQFIYQLVVNFVDAETGDFIPMTINGEPADGYPLEALFSMG